MEMLYFFTRFLRLNEFAHESITSEAALDNQSWLGYHIDAFGPVAQLGERYNRTVEVRGSSPLRSTSERVKTDRGPVAQLGERHNGIVEVRGSSPLRSTRLWISRQK
jgi:hypothetical protein